VRAAGAQDALVASAVQAGVEAAVLPAVAGTPALEIFGYVHGALVGGCTEAVADANLEPRVQTGAAGCVQGAYDAGNAATVPSCTLSVGAVSLLPPGDGGGVAVASTHSYVLRETSLETVIERFTEHAVRVESVTFAMVLECIARCKASVDRANIFKYEEYNNAQSREG